LNYGSVRSIIRFIIENINLCNFEALRTRTRHMPYGNLPCFLPFSKFMWTLFTNGNPTIFDQKSTALFLSKSSYSLMLIVISSFVTLKLLRNELINNRTISGSVLANEKSFFAPSAQYRDAVINEISFFDKFVIIAVACWTDSITSLFFLTVEARRRLFNRAKPSLLISTPCIYLNTEDFGKLVSTLISGILWPVRRSSLISAIFCSGINLGTWTLYSF